ncbi:MAG TPA: hypothetical protein DCE78_10105 [Bacteroidetes bacterium]|nr:hypothetical protein [Bacteroidota bacterium]
MGENSFTNIYIQDNTTLWVGGVDGLYRVNLLSMPEYSDSFHAQVNAVYLSQDSLIYGGNELEGTNVVVDYGDSDITLEYSAPRYIYGSGLRYQTRLVGYDEGWSNWSSENRRTYTNLSNGSYEFRVRAIDAFGIVSAEGSISVIVPTPWFKSIWAYLIYVGLIVAFGFLVVRIKTERIQRKNLELERKVIHRTAELQVEKRRLENLNENLRALDENRDKFLSVVAHDLRNPLMIVRSSADLIEEEIEDKAALLEFSGYIRDAALKMQNIIEDLLEDRAKKIRLHDDLSVFDMRWIVEKICAESKVWAESKHIEIIQDLDDGCIIKADSAQISVIVDNLVSNALKYSNPDSRIWVSLKKQGEKVLFSVRDEGQGMLKSEIQNIGMPSTKFSAKPTGGESSSGMGLYIVKDLLLIHQGELQVTSPGRGKGTTFTVVLNFVNNQGV